MKRIRVLVLMHEDLVPPESLRGRAAADIAQWRTEFDVVAALREMRHEVLPLGVYEDLDALGNALRDWKPDVVFNLLEEFHGESLFAHQVVGYLELVRQPYTGCNPRGLLVARDKALTKTILRANGIRTPDFAVFRQDTPARLPRRLSFPLFVKSLVEHGSYGVAHASIVHTEKQFRERIDYLRKELRTSVIVEEYVEGRELYVPVLGNERLRTLPVLELEFGRMPESSPRIATSRIKWDQRYQDRYGIDVGPARGLPRRLVAQVRSLGLRVCRVLEINGCARIDLRLGKSGEVHVLEANANPDLAREGELSIAARAAGMEYTELLGRLLRLGMAYIPESRGH